MTSRARLESSVAAAAAVAVAAGALLVSRDAEPPAVARAAATTPTQADPPRGIRVGCANQSRADFPRAFSDRRNLVVGPLVLVGGATYTDAATVREFGGNKFPLLVRAGHTVTVRVAPASRPVARLFYGPHPDGAARLTDGEHTMTFEACPPGERQSTPPEPVTFWSGFVMASRPGCVRLDVFVDDRRRPRRASVELGRRCAAPSPFSYEGGVGIVTGFAGGFVVNRRDCVPLEVRVAGRRTVRANVPFGAGRCPVAR